MVFGHQFCPFCLPSKVKKQKEIFSYKSIFRFPDRPGMVYSICDAMFGIGYTLGPFIGSILYEAGGFLLPFVLCGAAILGKSS